MPFQTASARKLRVLLSEGSSTSAREAITALGLAGHEVEIADPSPHCLGRFSRFVRRFHRCPPLSTDPEGYLRFILDVLVRRRFDVLVPIHEQGFLFARVRERLEPHVAVALPSFESYGQALSKQRFAELLSELGLPQPRTTILKSLDQLRKAGDFPFLVKTELGTASRGVWLIQDRTKLLRTTEEIERDRAFGDGILAQEFVHGPVEHAQAVYCRGRLVAMHSFRQLLQGAGGGDAVKESVSRPGVRQHLALIGERLQWHGALSVDYILRDGEPLYIDCNPRLVEPMSAVLPGVDLMDVLLRVSRGEEAPEHPPGRAGVRTHLAMQVLLGLALRGASRRELIGEGWKLLTGTGRYAGSREELTPVGLDWASLIPLLATVAALLVHPPLANSLAKRGWGDHLLTLDSMRKIEALETATSSTASRAKKGNRSPEL